MFNLFSRAEPKVSPPPALRRKRPLYLVLTEGDTLVLSTHEYGKTPKLVDVFELQGSSDWRFVNRLGLESTVSPYMQKLHEVVDIAQVAHVRPFKREKGLCHLFVAELQPGYRLHYLDFVRNRIPELYAQIASS